MTLATRHMIPFNPFTTRAFYLRHSSKNWQRENKLTAYAGPVVWNNLPVYIRAEPDIARFKNILKTYFLDSHLIY